MSLTVMLASQLSSQVINGLIPLGFGIYATLVGYGIVPANPGDARKSSAWRARWGGQARVGGPILILLGLFLTARALWW